jgi:magnesium transporter
MIRTVAVTKDFEKVHGVEVSQLVSGDFLWFWLDFDQPTDEEINLLRDPFHFHPLAIEDCMHHLQRPKLDYYDGYAFFVTQALNAESIEREEMDFFLSKQYCVSFHQQPATFIEEAWDRLLKEDHIEKWDPSHVFYNCLDGMVDNYFPHVDQIDDKLNKIEENSAGRSMEALLKDLYETRHDLLSLRHTITPMRDLLYRIINSQRLTSIEGKIAYFSDIYDHLLKLTEMVEASRELATDIRDSYISLNSNDTNHIMKVLTVITTIFMPLTFIVGVYGMNFRYMPELTWKYGYFGTLLLMVIIAVWMTIWFKKKGWFK